VISALRGAGVEVVERHVPVWEGRRERWTAGAGTAARIALAEVRLARRVPGDVDALVVGYPGQPDLAAARRAARGRPVVFNALVSLHETLVDDRRRLRSGSIAARALLALDRAALRTADLVVADTEANAEFLAALAGLPRSRVAVCLVGAEERLFRPGWRHVEPWTCLFVGKLIPLHGVNVVLEAARLASELPRGVELYAKAEHLNPGGSVKDRPALSMILEGERTGALTPEKIVLDATSGNTGIAYAMIGAARGYRVRLCLPGNASPERKRMLRIYGAELIETDPREGFDAPQRLAQRLAAELPQRVSRFRFAFENERDHEIKTERRNQPRR